jgi:hypothetical protein
MDILKGIPGFYPRFPPVCLGALGPWQVGQKHLPRLGGDHEFHPSSNRDSLGCYSAAQALGEKIDCLSIDEAAERACSAAARLSKEMNLPSRLRDLGVKEAQIPAMAEKAMGDWCHPFNPPPMHEGRHGCPLQGGVLTTQ